METNLHKKPHSHSHDHNDHSHDHEHTLVGELMCHLPYAFFSVALGLTILSFVSYFSLNGGDTEAAQEGADTLFHSFHFMHIAFAATGTLITFFRFSKNVVRALFVGVFSSTFFCLLSDVFLPYIGGELLGMHMHLHICFASELANVLPFMFVGILNGFVMSRHEAARQGMYSVFSHFAHIFISSLASIFYLVSHGFFHWQDHIGYVFLLLIVAVVVPCTLSDVVVPMLIAKADKKK